LPAFDASYLRPALAAFPDLNLLAYGNTDPLLGTFLGIPGTNTNFEYMLVK
jgi:hypothetical protein